MTRPPVEAQLRPAPTGPGPTSTHQHSLVRRVGTAIVIVAVLLAIRILSPSSLGLGDALQDAVTLAISVIVESLPFVVLGIALSIAVQLWVPQWLLLRILPRNPLLRRATLSLLGVLLPVCECGNVPLARGLVTRGVPVSDAMTFLLAAPILNPITIVVTYQAFGFSDGILACRVVGGFVIANLVGWLFSRHPHPEAMLTEHGHKMLQNFLQGKGGRA